MGRRITALAVVSAAALGVLAPGAGATTAPPPVVTVKVTITDSKIAVSPTRAARGAYARFILVNRGSQQHTFTLGSPNGFGFARRLRPSEHKVFLLFLNLRGTLAYRGTAAPDRSKAAMHGLFTIF